MAEWIKLEHTTPDKPEIVQLAAHLDIDHDAAFGKCVRFWIWTDQQSQNGHDLTVTSAFLDRLTNCPGFTDALVKVGWLRKRNTNFSVPNFDRHNGQTAKNRALARDRKRASRKSHGMSVTKTGPEVEVEVEVEVPPPTPPPPGEVDEFLRWANQRTGARFSNISGDQRKRLKAHVDRLGLAEVKRCLENGLRDFMGTNTPLPYFVGTDKKAGMLGNWVPAKEPVDPGAREWEQPYE